MSTPTTIKQVLASIIDILLDDANLQALVANRTYLHVPEKPISPYIVARITSVVDASSKGLDAQNGVLGLTYWSDQRGDALLYDMWDAAYAVLQRRQLTVDDGRLVKLWHASSQFQTHQDGLTYFMLDQYNFIIS